MSSHDLRYDIVLRPQLTDTEGHPRHGGTLRTATVQATGQLGASGYPRYAGEGVVADVDPRTRNVEAVTVDGEELPYGWVAQVAQLADGPVDPSSPGGLGGPGGAGGPGGPPGGADGPANPGAAEGTDG
jgi:hypothetical protein